MLGIFFTQDSLIFDAPINTKRVIKDADATISLRMIELIALILEHGGLAQYGEAVSEATWYEELLTKLTIDN